MKYQQLTSNERYMISRLRMQGYTQASIARLLGRHRSTISREFARNTCWLNDGAYRPATAERRTRARRSRSRRNRHFYERDFVLVRRLLRKRWSPEQITNYIKLHGLMPRTPSHESIYLYIWRDKACGGKLWTHLRQASKRRRKRYSAYDSRGRLANKRMIGERPVSIEKRDQRPLGNRYGNGKRLKRLHRDAR